MPNKNKIYLVVIGIALLLTGFFVYKTIAGPGGAEAPVLNQVVNIDPSVSILPMGNKFDTSVVKKLSSQFNIFSYPKLDPQSVGVSISNLIKSPAEAPKN